MPSSPVGSLLARLSLVSSIRRSLDFDHSSWHGNLIILFHKKVIWTVRQKETTSTPNHLTHPIWERMMDTQQRSATTCAWLTSACSFCTQWTPATSTCGNI